MIKKNGFTLIEMMAGVSLITIGIFAAIGVIQKFYLTTSLYLDRFTASYLAQEGIEIVRNIRDSNWLQGKNWNEGLKNCSSSSCGADYNDFSLNLNRGDSFLKLNQEGYNYNHGTDTKFKRKIIVSSCTNSNSNSNSNDCLNVEVKVNWGTRGKDYSVVIQENIYNWNK